MDINVSYKKFDSLSEKTIKLNDDSRKNIQNVIKKLVKSNFTGKIPVWMTKTLEYKNFKKENNEMIGSLSMVGMHTGIFVGGSIGATTLNPVGIAVGMIGGGIIGGISSFCSSNPIVKRLQREKLIKIIEKEASKIYLQFLNSKKVQNIFKKYICPFSKHFISNPVKCMKINQYYEKKYIDKFIKENNKGLKNSSRPKFKDDGNYLSGLYDLANKNIKVIPHPKVFKDLIANPLKTKKLIELSNGVEKAKKNIKLYSGIDKDEQIQFYNKKKNRRDKIKALTLNF